MERTSISPSAIVMPRISAYAIGMRFWIMNEGQVNLHAYSSIILSDCIPCAPQGSEIDREIDCVW